MEIDTQSPPLGELSHAFKARKQRPGRQQRSVVSSDATPIPTDPNPVPSTVTELQPSEDSVMQIVEDINERADESDEASHQTNGRSVAEILRMRKSGRARKGGLDFNTTRTRRKTPELEDEETLAEKDAVDKEVNAVVNRFTHQTGAMVDVDEHM